MIKHRISISRVDFQMNFKKTGMSTRTFRENARGSFLPQHTVKYTKTFHERFLELVQK